MKRADQLAPLSREHHQGLVVAQHAIRIKPEEETFELVHEKWQAIKEYLATQVDEHFKIEERYILEPMKAFEECEDMVARIYEEHKYMRDFAKEPVGDDLEILQGIGEMLKAHIKFEEKTLFPTAQKVLTEEQLDAALAAHPESQE